MTDKRKLHEDYHISCQYLVKRIWNEEDVRVRPLLLDDLVTKYFVLNSETPGRQTEVSQKQTIDIIIFTVIGNELPSVKLALGIEPSLKEDENLDGIRLWHFPIHQKNPDRERSAILVFISESTNVASAAVCSSIFSRYDAHTAILIGIAAGVKKKIKLGDVVAANQIIYYEHQSLKEEGPQKRPIPYPLDVMMKRSLENFNPETSNWKKELKKLKMKLKKIGPLQINIDDIDSSFKKGVILSGEKLIRNGTLSDLAKEYHEQTLAAEEEAGGFCKACDNFKVPWLVFRGISDYGDPSKNKKLQSFAALAAASVATTFLRTEFRFPDEVTVF